MIDEGGVQYLIIRAHWYMIRYMRSMEVAVQYDPAGVIIADEQYQEMYCNIRAALNACMLPLDFPLPVFADWLEERGIEAGWLRSV